MRYADIIAEDAEYIPIRNVPQPWGGSINADVIKNPHISDVVSLVKDSLEHKVKGVVTPKGTVFIWKAEEGVHNHICMALKLREPSSIVISNGPNNKPDDWKNVEWVCRNKGAYLFMDDEAYPEAVKFTNLAAIFPAEKARGAQKSPSGQPEGPVIAEDLLDEEVTAKPMNLFHGTDSDAFASFAPDKAKKGMTHYNPLGQGMYATDSLQFAKRFGRNVHRVVIPAGARYKRITQRQWAQSVGRNIVAKALRAAFKERGLDYAAYVSGRATEPEENWSRMPPGAVVDAYYEYCLRRKQPAGGHTGLTSDSLRGMVKALNTKGPRVPVGDCRERMQDLWGKLDDLLANHPPYESLRDASGPVDELFGMSLALAFSRILPVVANAVFSEYDFVIFTDTLDHGTGRGGRSALEVLIFNPEYQKTSAMTGSDYINAHLAA